MQGLPLQVETHLEQRELFSPWSWLANWVSSSPNGKPHELLFSLCTACCIALFIFLLKSCLLCSPCLLLKVEFNVIVCSHKHSGSHGESVIDLQEEEESNVIKISSAVTH